MANAVIYWSNFSRHHPLCKCYDCTKRNGQMLLEFMLIHNPEIAKKWIKNVWDSYEEHGNGD